MEVKDLNIEDLQALRDDEPVVMVNLVRLEEKASTGEGSGWEAYKRYSAVTAPMIKKRGGTVIWVGRVGAVAFGITNENIWDFIALVRYPSRAAFLDMMTSEECVRSANPHRLDGVIEHVILATRETYSKFKEERV
jgi:uncharacterized protein (DUF1330 family)